MDTRRGKCGASLVCSAPIERTRPTGAHLVARSHTAVSFVAPQESSGDSRDDSAAADDDDLFGRAVARIAREHFRASRVVRFRMRMIQ